MSRRIILIAVLGLMIACSQQAKKEGEITRPNILLISIDTLRPDHLGCYGYRRPTSPVIDALAESGVLFEQAYSHSPKTALSHMSLFTSLYPEEHGVDQWTNTGAKRLSDSISTLATLLQKAGYRTSGISGGGHVRAELGFDQGMDSYFDVERVNDAVKKAASQIHDFSFPESKSPFFVFLHTYAVHDPYTPPEKFAQQFTQTDYRGKIIRSGTDLRRMTGTDWKERSRLFWSLVDQNSPEDLQHLKDLYDGAIRFTDHQLGRLFQQLRDWGILKNTLIIFLSDHGEEFLEHNNLRHDQIYQELLHVPLVLVFPENSEFRFSARRETAIVRLVDVMPTVLEIAHIPVPEGIRGVSLLKLLQKGEAPPLEVYSSWAHLKALRTENQKLILKQHDAPLKELFFLNEDPAEQRDLADRHPENVRRMEDRLNVLVEQSRVFQQSLKTGRLVVPDQETLERLKALGYIDDTKP